MDVKGAYGENLTLATEFEGAVKHVLEKRYNRCAAAVRSIKSALDKATAQMKDAIKPLQTHFGGVVEVVGTSKDHMKILDSDPTDRPYLRTQYAAIAFQCLDNIRGGEIVDVQCKILEEQNPSLIKRLEDIWISEDHTAKDYGVTQIVRGFDRDPKSDKPHPGNLLGRYAVPVIRIWPTYGVAGFLNRSVLDHQLISDEGVREATILLGRLDYKVISGKPLEEMQQKVNPEESYEI